MHQTIDSIPFAAIAGDMADYVHALALTEHFGHTLTPDCIYGLCRFGSDDAGKAFGLLQQHLPFINTWYRAEGPPYGVADEDDVPTGQIKAAARFLKAFIPLLGLDGAVQSYQTGIAAYRVGQRNQAYLDKFTAALMRVRSGK
jgi:hypothetical protein